MKMMKNKYGNRKVVYGGREFASKLEGERWLFLRDAERRGLISGLRCQVPFTLFPDEYTDEEVRMKTKTKTVTKRTYTGVRYVADFIYFSTKKGQYVVEDTKGMQTPEFKLKMKMMHYLKRIDIRLVRKPAEEV